MQLTYHLIAINLICIKNLILSFRRCVFFCSLPFHSFDRMFNWAALIAFHIFLLLSVPWTVSDILPFFPLVAIHLDWICSTIMIDAVKLKTPIHQIIFSNSTILCLSWIFVATQWNKKANRPQIDTTNDSSRKVKWKKVFRQPARRPTHGMRKHKQKKFFFEKTEQQKQKQNTTIIESIKTIWPHAVTQSLCLCMLYYLDRINASTQNKCELAPFNRYEREEREGDRVKRTTREERSV